MTAAVQFGFVIGTLTYAWLSVADRISPIKVFAYSAVIAAGFNLLLLFSYRHWVALLAIRVGVGFFLAGVYPVGMKICSDWYDKGLGKSLGYLVGALVLGTAFPHALKAMSWQFNWQLVIVFTSVLAATGALLLAVFIQNGPHRRASGGFQPNVLGVVVKPPLFRTFAYGYFGHMWEIYTFWAFVPLIIELYNQLNNSSLAVSSWSFGIISIGTVGCILTGELSKRFGSGRLAFGALALSTMCCLLSPLLFYMPAHFFLIYLFVWGLAVPADSPQFSTLVSQYALPEYRATAITLVNSIGFLITIPSLFLTQWLFATFSQQYSFMMLSVGGLLGLLRIRKTVFK
jgi:MFS family permease